MAEKISDGEKGGERLSVNSLAAVCAREATVSVHSSTLCKYNIMTVTMTLTIFSGNKLFHSQNLSTAHSTAYMYNKALYNFDFA